jgi:hypothetical protein
MERKLACVERKRSRSPGAAEIARMLAEMRSSDDEVRAQAVRRACPCQLPWDVFRHVRKAAQRLQRDPSPLVRANALHVAEDAREIEMPEALREWLIEHDDGPEDAPGRSQRHRQHPRTKRR